MDSCSDLFMCLFTGAIGEEGGLPLSLPFCSQRTVPLATYKSSFAHCDPWRQNTSPAANWHHTSPAEVDPEEPNTRLNVSALVKHRFA